MNEKKPLVLIVDDEIEICNLLSKYLDKNGYKTAIAHSGEKAIELVKTMQPDVILLDIRMPGMGGVEAFKRIREIDNKSVIIVITASDERDKSVEAIKDDLDGYLSKPIMLTDLKLIIEKALEHR